MITSNEYRSSYFFITSAGHFITFFFLFSLFSRGLCEEVYPSNDYRIKLTRETKSKATISLEKLVKIATSRVSSSPNFPRYDPRDRFTPVPLQRFYIPAAYRSADRFPFSRRQFHLHNTRGNKRKSPRCVDRMTIRNALLSRLTTSNLGLSRLYFFMFFTFFYCLLTRYVHTITDIRLWWITNRG